MEGADPLSAQWSYKLIAWARNRGATYGIGELIRSEKAYAGATAGSLLHMINRQKDTITIGPNDGARPRDV